MRGKHGQMAPEDVSVCTASHSVWKRAGFTCFVINNLVFCLSSIRCLLLGFQQLGMIWRRDATYRRLMLIYDRRDAFCRCVLLFVIWWNDVIRILCDGFCYAVIYSFTMFSTVYLINIRLFFSIQYFNYNVLTAKFYNLVCLVFGTCAADW